MCKETIIPLQAMLIMGHNLKLYTQKQLHTRTLPFTIYNSFSVYLFLSA